MNHCLFGPTAPESVAQMPLSALVVRAAHSSTLTRHEIEDRTRRVLAAGEDPFVDLHDDEQLVLCQLAVARDAHFLVGVCARAFAPLPERNCRVPRTDLTALGLTPSGRRPQGLHCHPQSPDGPAARQETRR